MNRVKRDYCSKNHHPRWKAWTAKYESTLNARLIGYLCDFCGQKINDTVAYGVTNNNFIHLGWIRIVSNRKVGYQEHEAAQKRYLKYLERRHALIRNLRIKGNHYASRTSFTPHGPLKIEQTQPPSLYDKSTHLYHQAMRLGD